MSAVVYRLRDAGGSLLYVGMSGTALLRLHQHSKQKWWWVQVANVELMHYETRELALAAERRAIESEHPRYNIDHNENIEHWNPPRSRPEPAKAVVVPIRRKVELPQRLCGKCGYDFEDLQRHDINLILDDECWFCDAYWCKPVDEAS